MTGFFLGGSLAPAGLAISFLRATFEAVTETLTKWRTDLGQTIESTEAAFSDAVALLEPFEAPWTRELAFACGEWTAYLNNSIDGGDPTSAAPYLGRAIGVDLLVAIHSPRRGPGHASTQLWVLGPSGESRRTIAAYAVDGRWSWETQGTPLPFEQAEQYGVRRIRDRFDRAMLVQYLDASGVKVDEEEFYGRGLLVRKQVSYPTRKMTAREMLDGFGW